MFSFKLPYHLVQEGIDYDNKIVFAAAWCIGGGRGFSTATRASSHNPQEARRQLNMTKYLIGLNFGGLTLSYLFWAYLSTAQFSENFAVFTIKYT